MSSSYEAMRRHWYILASLPQFPKMITTKDLQERLASEGIEASLRKLQRDLNYLSSLALFPISSEECGRQLKWFWPKDCRAISLPTMTTSVALTLYLTNKYLRNLLPQHLHQELQPYFETAEAVLDNNKDQTVQWRNKIAFINAGPQFTDISLSEATNLNEIYSALFQERRIEAYYRPRNQNAKSYTLDPLAITAKGHRIYLIARGTDGQVKQYFIPRFESVIPTETVIDKQPSFVLKDYINQQAAFDYPLSKSIQTIELRVDKRFAYYFNETQIGEQQTFKKSPDGHYYLSAKATITDELLWWLISRAEMIEVLAPKTLRTKVIENLTQGLRNYSQR